MMANVCEKMDSTDEDYDYDDYEQYMGGKCKQHINNASVVKGGAKKPIQQANLKTSQLKEQKKEKQTAKKELSPIVKTPEIKAKEEVVDDWEDLL